MASVDTLLPDSWPVLDYISRLSDHEQRAILRVRKEPDERCGVIRLRKHLDEELRRLATLELYNQAAGAWVAGPEIGANEAFARVLKSAPFTQYLNSYLL